MALDLRKDFIIYYIVLGTNVFSRDGVNGWNFFSFRSLCGSRLVNYQLTLLVFGCRTSKRDGLDDEGLCGSSPIFLLGFSFLGGWGIVSGVLEFALSGFGISCPGFLLF